MCSLTRCHSGVVTQLDPSIVAAPVPAAFDKVDAAGLQAAAVEAAAETGKLRPGSPGISTQPTRYDPRRETTENCNRPVVSSLVVVLRILGCGVIGKPGKLSLGLGLSLSWLNHIGLEGLVQVWRLPMVGFYSKRNLRMG